MANVTTVGKLLVRNALPEDMRSSRPQLNKKAVQAILQEVAEKHPEQYRAVLKRLGDVGRDVAYSTGGLSFGLAHLKTPPRVKLLRHEIRHKINGILADPKIAGDAKQAAIIELLLEMQGKVQEASAAYANEQANPLYRQAVSGSRGNLTQLNSLLGSDLLYTDKDNQPIPLAVLRNYSEGMTPAEYFAGAFGARKGLADVKLGTAKGGFLGKQLVQLAHRLVVTDDDDDVAGDTNYDETRPRGLPIDVDDADNEGALLSHPVGGFARNTVITPEVQRSLRKQGIERILVRSPLVGGPRNGGVYAKDAGYREKNRLPAVGDFIGVAAAQALAEPISQSMLCLALGTQVRMADGSTKAIEDILVGDYVLGADTGGTTFPVEVTAWYNNGVRRCYRTTFRDVSTYRIYMRELTSTLDHKLLTQDSETDIVEVRPVGRSAKDFFAVFAKQEYEPSGKSKLISQEYVGECATYDIGINSKDHLFVLANGLIVSNSSKHTGGVAGATAGSVEGFELFNQLIQTPKTFKGGATHAQVDGVVDSVQEAPQGGTYITVAGTKHYAPQGVAVIAKPGEEVEAGDTLSEGIPNPAEIVKHKGIGEGRRYFTEQFRNALRSADVVSHRRNVELVGRGLINHVRLTEELGEWIPDDIVPYTTLERDWTPRQGTQRLRLAAAKGKYLEQPVLHYSIGTPLRPSVIKMLQQYGVEEVDAHDEPPPFEPEMVRGMEIASRDTDWMARMLGSYQQRSLLSAAQRGATSDTEGTSYVPALADPSRFAQTGATKGWSGVATPSATAETPVAASTITAPDKPATDNPSPWALWKRQSL